ncbi:MAG: alpha/beta hydrolase [Chloroflexi bacterium]|nr:alpha/beta hydrolase [Chloroflexota bacterium]
MSKRPNERTVTVGALPIQLASAGSGPPLIYLHGAFGYLGWPEFLNELAERFTVYAPLHPGFGESGDADEFDDLLDLTLFHLDLLDELRLESPDVVGHFFGAMMAAELAAIAGNRVNRLVLTAPMGLWLEEHPGIDYFAAAPDKLRSILFADADSDTALRWLPDPESDEQRHLQRIERTRSLATIAKFMWPIPDKGLKKRLHRIDHPTLVVVAEQDQLVAPAYGNAFADRIQGAEVSTISGAGHLCHLERPGQYGKLLGRFLSR